MAATVVDVAGDVAELEARRGDEPPGDTSIHPGDRDPAVLHAALQPLAAEEIELSSIELLASLVAPADAEAAVLERLRVKVYHDRDGDGSVGTADELLCTGSFSESGRARGTTSFAKGALATLSRWPASAKAMCSSALAGAWPFGPVHAVGHLRVGYD